MLALLVVAVLAVLLLLACRPDDGQPVQGLDWFALPLNTDRAARRGRVQVLARGGIVAPRPGGTLVMLGNGERETVVPLRRPHIKR